MPSPSRRTQRIIYVIFCTVLFIAGVPLMLWGLDYPWNAIFITVFTVAYVAALRAPMNYLE